MVDREKAIKGLEYCIETCCGADCPYWNGSMIGRSCIFKLHADIFALLKEQEPVEPILSVKDRCYYCGNCEEVEVKTYDHYCPRCGRELKWT